VFYAIGVASLEKEHALRGQELVSLVELGVQVGGDLVLVLERTQYAEELQPKVSETRYSVNAVDVQQEGAKAEMAAEKAREANLVPEGDTGAQVLEYVDGGRQLRGQPAHLCACTLRESARSPLNTQYRTHTQLSYVIHTHTHSLSLSQFHSNTPRRKDLAAMPRAVFGS
jgi:hypothetical protein